MNIDCLICDIDRNADDLLSLYRSRFKLKPIDDELAIEAVNECIRVKREELQNDLDQISEFTKLPRAVTRKISALNWMRAQDNIEQGGEKESSQGPKGEIHNSSMGGADR